jgi:hypothetical protein
VAKHVVKHSKIKHRAKFVTGDGRRFATMEAAISHANKVFQSTGVVISVEAARAGGGKARHAPERSRLRPFATYCASCHKHISGTEHVWKIAGDKYLCNACGSATGGGKRRHANPDMAKAQAALREAKAYIKRPSAINYIRETVQELRNLIKR